MIQDNPKEENKAEVLFRARRGSAPVSEQTATLLAEQFKDRGEEKKTRDDSGLDLAKDGLELLSMDKKKRSHENKEEKKEMIEEDDNSGNMLQQFEEEFDDP